MNNIAKLLLLGLCLFLVSCQMFQGCPESIDTVKEQKIAVAVDMCYAAQEEEDPEKDEELDQMASVLIEEAFEYIIDQADMLEEHHKDSLRLYYSDMDGEECESVEMQLRLGIVLDIRSMLEEQDNETSEESAEN